MKKTQNIFFFAILLITCYGCSDRSLTSLDVYTTFSCNGQELGDTKTIVLPNLTDWGVTHGAVKDQISLGFKSPLDGKSYGGWIINSPDGTPLHIGSNPDCYLALMNGNNVYSSYHINVNLTHITTTINETYEGTFSGIVTKAISSPFSMNDYPCSGSFKAPLK
jgi:hypothetical protein